MSDPVPGPEAAAPHADGTKPVLEARHLTRWHGEVIGVNGIDLTLEPGITGLLGPNGSGKSTLLRLAVGLQQPSQGTIRVLGEDPWDNPRLLARIGYVPEGKAPWSELTGESVVRRGALLAGVPEDRIPSAARAALDKVGLEEAAQRPASSYSHGMQQRLKLALALVHGPDLLILDEPLLGTDPLARRDLLDALRAFAAGGGSVLLSTHVLTDVEALTDRVALIHHGRLLAHGGIREIRDLLDRHPRRIRIQTPQPRDLGARLMAWPTVASVEADADAVVVRTKDPLPFHRDLQALLASGAVPFTSVVPQDESLDAVFQYLVG